MDSTMLKAAFYDVPSRYNDYIKGLRMVGSHKPIFTRVALTRRYFSKHWQAIQNKYFILINCRPLFVLVFLEANHLWAGGYASLGRNYRNIIDI